MENKNNSDLHRAVEQLSLESRQLIAYFARKAKEKRLLDQQASSCPLSALKEALR